MGEVVMKTGYKQNFLIISALVLFFILSAFTFMNYLYCLSECIGSTVCGSVDIALRDLLRSHPIFLSFYLSLSGLMVAHTFYRNESPTMLHKRAKKHAVIGIVLGSIIITYVLIMRIAGKYLSLIEGSPSRFYPLDAVLYAAVFIILGVCILKYLGKIKELSAPSRAPITKKLRGIRCFFRTFWLLIGLYGFCGFFYGIFIIDFSNGYIPYILASMFVSFDAFMSIVVWELYYNNKTEEKRKKITLPLALVSLVFSLGAAIFYLIALKNNLEGPANVGFGVLPVAFSSDVNLATMLVVAVPLIVSVTGVIKGVYRRHTDV